MATLHLKKPAPPTAPSNADPLEIIAYDETPEQLEYNSTLHVPTHHQHMDYSHLPPPGDRGSVPVQAPKRVWGNPRLFHPSMSPASPPAGAQPLFVPPRGK